MERGEVTLLEQMQGSDASPPVAGGPLQAEIARREAAEAALVRAEAELRAARRRIDDLSAANAGLEEFAHNACHDLRAPLRALGAIPGWLREGLERRYGAVDDEIGLDLQEMEVQSRRMGQLLDDLLTYARIGQGAPEAVEIDTDAAVAECLEHCAVPDGFEVRVQPGLPRVRAVPAEFSLVLQHLVGNAVKHHDRPAGRIGIRAWTQGGEVHFEVCDDGPGIRPENSDRIFEALTTLKPRDEVEGSGMGLAMARRVMGKLGGAVRLIANGAERGATFRLTFPRAGAAAGSNQDDEK